MTDSVAAVPGTTTGTVLNDVHSQLSPTRVARVVRPTSVEGVQEAIVAAAAANQAISIMGGGHAMGGQQFGTDTICLDMRGLSSVHGLDAEHGLVELGAGIEWPQLIDWLDAEQQGRPHPWAIAQKQTGADRLTLGGSLSANAHGRGLNRPPLVADVEAFQLIDASGTAHICSRTDNTDLFALAIGGYGLFGTITQVTLRLAPRQKVQRVVEIANAVDIIEKFQQRIDDGFLYGDFQVSIDTTGDDFLRRGVFSCCRPVPDSTPILETQKHLSREDWTKLLYLSHVDKRRAVDLYEGYYASTSGQVYWSDRHQLADYLDNYHAAIDPLVPDNQKGTELITEIYVPRPRLVEFLEACREDFRAHDVNAIYTTVRLVERDSESFLPWARQAYVGMIFNLHVVHSPEGIEGAAVAFRRLIDHGIAFGGSYYLTYHRFASREQVLTCYPQFPEYLRLKRSHDPEERFQSDWYRHYRQMFAM